MDKISTSGSPMAIYNRLKVLIAEKEIKERRKLTYRVIAEETGLSTNTLTTYANQNVTRFDAVTLNTLCHYFDCQPGDILVWDKDDPYVTAMLADQIATDEEPPEETFISD